MNKHKKLMILFAVLFLLFSMSIAALAANYSGDDVKPGTAGIQPQDTLTMPENTDWATLTAIWGVRVTFVDWDKSELKTEVVPVTDDSSGSTSAPDDPVRKGYAFEGWVRNDTSEGAAVLNGDGSVTDIKGPGPIVFMAKYTKEVTPGPVVKPKVGNLTISKSVSGEGADSNAEFAFTVTLNKTNISGTYGDLYFKKGVAEFTLKGGESRTAKKLPAGVEFAVTEKDYSSDGYTTTKTGDTGSIVKDKTLTASFTNTKDAVEPVPPAESKVGNLEVSKIVSGKAADKEKKFNFTVTLGDININGTYGDMNFVRGVAAISLKDGESMTAKNLPAGTVYTVKEEDYSKDGYSTDKKDDTGKIEKGKTISVSFINTKDTEVTNPESDESAATGKSDSKNDSKKKTSELKKSSTPKTGDSSNVTGWIVLLVLSAAVVAGIMLRRGKRNRTE